MHRNLKVPSVTPVILGLIMSPVMHQPIKFQHSPAMHDSELLTT